MQIMFLVLLLFCRASINFRAGKKMNSHIVQSFFVNRYTTGEIYKITFAFRNPGHFRDNMILTIARYDSTGSN